MKKLLLLLSVAAVFALAALTTSCGKDDPTPEIPEKPQEPVDPDPPKDKQKFYYAFDEKVYLYEVDGRVVAVWGNGDFLIADEDDPVLEDPAIVVIRPLLASVEYGDLYPYTNEIVVQFADSVKHKQRDAVMKKYGLTVLVSGYWLDVFIVPFELDPLDVANAIYESGLVNSCHPEFKVNIIPMN